MANWQRFAIVCALLGSCAHQTEHPSAQPTHPPEPERAIAASRPVHRPVPVPPVLQDVAPRHGDYTERRPQLMLRGGPRWGDSDRPRVTATEAKDPIGGI